MGREGREKKWMGRERGREEEEDIWEVMGEEEKREGEGRREVGAHDCKFKVYVPNTAHAILTSMMIMTGMLKAQMKYVSYRNQQLREGGRGGREGERGREGGRVGGRE